ncbi:MAG TPA: archaeosortase/exosortase family protein [Burkholderiales bacterium]|nr:archaeosortase/exosortase family protein [Burkholderiales bacterium]
MAEDFSSLHLIAFFSTAALVLLLEGVRPFQRRSVTFARRWATNIGLLLIVSAITSFAMPDGLHAYAQAAALGPVARAGMPMAIEIVLTFLFIDLWRYWEHRFLHRVPFLWRVHLVHHSDTQVDVTTTERHHPLESVLSTATMMALILYCGLPAAGVGLYIVVATVVALWSHANLRSPERVDRLLRWVFVTPRVHAVHHSSVAAETDSNYGTVLTAWDRLFGSYVDPVRARIPHFGLEYFHQPRDTTLGRVLQQPFLYRPGMPYPDRSGKDEVAPAWQLSLSPRWRTVLSSALLGCALAAIVLWETMSHLASIWTNSESYQYAWLVVPMIVYLLVWERRSDTLAVSPQPGLAGVLVATIAAALWAVAALANIDLGRHIAVALVLQGVAMAMLGWSAYWRLFPILALLFFAIPSGDLLQPVLRWLTLKSIELGALAAQLPYTAEGFVVHVDGNRYMVIDECSGLSYVTLAMFLSYSFGLLIYRSFFKIAALTVFGAFLGVFSNAVRVNFIIMVDWLRGSQMELSAHAGFQWLGLLVTLGALFFIASRAKADASDAAPLAASSMHAPIGLNGLAPAGAGLVVLLIVGAFAVTPASKVQRGDTAQVVSPPQLLGWSLTTPSATWVVDAAQRSRSIDLAYRHDGKSMQVRIVEMLVTDVKLSDSWLVPDSGRTWRSVDTKRQLACTESGCVPLLHSTLKRPKHPGQRHAFYSFSIGTFSTDSILALRLAQGWHRFLGDGASPRLIALVFDDQPPATDNIAASLLTLRATLKGSAQGT